MSKLILAYSIELVMQINCESNVYNDRKKMCVYFKIEIERCKNANKIVKNLVTNLQFQPASSIKK